MDTVLAAWPHFGSLATMKMPSMAAPLPPVAVNAVIVGGYLSGTVRNTTAANHAMAAASAACCAGDDTVAHPDIQAPIMRPPGRAI